MSYERDEDENEDEFIRRLEQLPRLDQLEEIEKQKEKEIEANEKILKLLCEGTDKEAKSYCVRSKKIISEVKEYLKELKKEIRKSNKNYPFVFLGGGSKKTRRHRKKTKTHQKKFKKTRSKKI